MTAVTNYGGYKYPKDRMRRIESCAYIYAAEHPGIYEYAIQRGTCIGQMAINYTVKAIIYTMERGYAKNFGEALELIEESQVNGRWRKRYREVMDIVDGYFADTKDYTWKDAEKEETMDAMYAELTAWRDSQSAIIQQRIREIANSTGELTKVQYHNVQYMLRSGKYRNVLTPTDLVYLLRTYLKDA